MSFTHPRSFVFAFLVGCSLSGLAGCNQLAKVGVGTTPISDVVANPSKYSNVTVRGKVTNQLGVLGTGAYELKDDSGSLWVVTQNGLPSKDTEMVIKGSAAEGVTIAGQRLAVTITEKERL
jgi:hypothetical protein